jgi:hypothetical protein
MTQRMIDVAVSPDLSPTTADLLGSDCMRIETSSRIQLAPHTETRINLMVHNSSPVGRMGQIIANYDSREVVVKIPTSNIYVAPEGKTIVYAIISPLLNHGQTKIIFDVF